MADRRTEIERALSSVAPLAGQTDRQLPGERSDGLAQGDELLAAGVHEVDVLGEGLTDRLGHCLSPPVGHQSATDFRFDLGAQLVDPSLVLLAGEALL